MLFRLALNTFSFKYTLLGVINRKWKLQVAHAGDLTYLTKGLVDDAELVSLGHSVLIVLLNQIRGLQGQHTRHKAGTLLHITCILTVYE